LETFTIVTGIASLIGFGIQMFDIFPQLGRHRKELALVFLGIFIGSLIRAIEPASIRLKLDISWTVVLVGFFVVTFFAIIWMAAISDRQDRQAKYSDLLRYLVLIFAMIVGPRLLFSSNDATRSIESLTINQLRVLAKDADSRKDYGKAAYFLGIIDERLPVKDPRSISIKQQIKELQLKEVR
jgi:hypothetical protein